MRPFELTAPATVEDALAGGGTYLAGGTTLGDPGQLFPRVEPAAA